MKSKKKKKEKISFYIYNSLVIRRDFDAAIFQLDDLYYIFLLGLMMTMTRLS